MPKNPQKARKYCRGPECQTGRHLGFPTFPGRIASSRGRQGLYVGRLPAGAVRGGCVVWPRLERPVTGALIVELAEEASRRGCRPGWECRCRACRVALGEITRPASRSGRPQQIMGQTVDVVTPPREEWREPVAAEVAASVGVGLRLAAVCGALPRLSDEDWEAVRTVLMPDGDPPMGGPV